MKSFSQTISIRFRQADPAGIAFFGNVPGFAHDCFEDFIVDLGMTWAEWFQSEHFIVPIRHLECNFHSPFFAGKKYQVEAVVAQIRDSSFQMKYTFSKDQKPCAEVTMVHTFLDKKSKKKISIPETIRSRLEKYLL
jgi:acyl-CoA thioesterase FadM